MSASALIASKFKTCSAFQRVCVRIGIFFRENKINMLTWCDRRSGASVTISQHSQITHASVVKCKGCNGLFVQNNSQPPECVTYSLAGAF